MTEQTSTDSDSELLNETIARAAEDWSDETILIIISGLRAQRDRWNVNQASGSKARVTSKKIPVKKKQSKGAKAISLAAGLKKLRV